MQHLTNERIHTLLLDATEEASRIDSASVWKPIGHNWWAIYDLDDHHLGWVDARVDCCSGVATFRYQAERTYVGVVPIDPVSVDAGNLSDPEELDKLTQFDSAIISAHRL